MSQRLQLHVIAVVALFLPVALPPAVFADDLLDIYRLAIANDPTYQAARATYLAAKQKWPQARAALLPTLSASAGKTRNRVEVSAPGVEFVTQGEAEYSSEEYTLTLTQPVYNFPSFTRLRQAKFVVAQAAAEFAVAEQELIRRTARTYVDLLAAEDNLQFAGAERTAIARQLELASARLEVGMGTITDRHEAEARFQLAEARVTAAANAREEAVDALGELIGRAPGPLVRLAGQIPLTLPNPADIDSWLADALEGNLALKSRRRAVEISRQEVKIQRGAHLPSLDLVASHRRLDSSGSVSGPGFIRDNTDISLQLSVPLIEGGLVLSKTKEAQYKLDAARQELKRQQRATVREVRAAFLGVKSSVSMVEALRQAVTASESALEGKIQGFQANINTNIAVLDAQRDLYRAKRDHARARYDYVLNLLRLKQAVGGLDLQALEQANGWLEG